MGIRDEVPTNVTTSGWSRAAWIGISVLFLATVLRGFVIPAPIYSGDEYAYFRHGANLSELAIVKERDPAIQSPANFGYLALVRVAVLSTEMPLQVIGVCQAFVWLGVITAIWWVSRRALAGPVALLPPALSAAMPFAAYTTAVMPEILLGAGFWLLTVLVAHYSARREWIRLSAGAGAVCGAMLLIKIHAVALLGASLLLLVARARCYEPGGSLARRAGRLATLVGTLFGSCLLTYVIIRWLVAPEAHGSVIGGSYTSILRTITPGLAGTLVFGTLRYVLVHLHLLALFFLPALLPSRGLDGSTAVETDSGSVSGAVGTFWYVALGCHVGMIGLFTTLVGLSNKFETDRLHERYYWYLVPALMILAIRSVRTMSMKRVQVTAGFALANSLVFLAFTSATFKIFPWDAVDFFGLFRGHAAWGFQQPFPWMTVGLYVILILGSVVDMIRPANGIATWAGRLGVLFVTSTVGALSWQLETRETAQRLFGEARALDRLVNGAPFLVLGAERYGPMAYYLAGLTVPPYVRVTDGETIRAKDLPAGVRAVAVFGQNRFEGATQARISCGAVMTYLVGEGGRLAGGGMEQEPQAKEEVTNEFWFSSGRIRWKGEGFNVPEAWGSWTAGPTASLALRHPVHGRVRIRLWGWVDETVARQPVVFRLCGAEHQLTMETVGQEYDFLLSVPRNGCAGAGMLEIRSRVYHSGGRTLGVALRELKIIEERDR